jgi:hypothetical protein
MAPGGLLWSESPIPRSYSPRVPMVGAEEPPVAPTPTYSRHWKFDDAGGALLEQGGGSPFNLVSSDPLSITYHASPLASGSTYSVSLDPLNAPTAVQMTDGASPSITQGWVAWDFWMAVFDTGVVGDWTNTLGRAQLDLGAHWIRVSAGGDEVTSATTPTIVLRVSSSPGEVVGDPADIIGLIAFTTPIHIQCGVDYDLGRVVIKANGTTVLDQALSSGWGTGAGMQCAFSTHLLPIGADEVRVYTSSSAPF